MTQSMVVYVGLAITTTFLAQLEHLNSDEIPSWTWVGWSRFGGYLLLAAFTTFKAYVSRPPGNGSAPTGSGNGPEPTGSIKLPELGTSAKGSG